MIHSREFLFYFSWLNHCCSSQVTVENEDGITSTIRVPPKTSFLFQPLEFEIGDYVLDLTYTQTLCW